MGTGHIVWLLKERIIMHIMNTSRILRENLDLLGLEHTPTTANRYADTYITTVLPGSYAGRKAEAVLRQIVKDANVVRRSYGHKALRICARGRGKNRLERARAMGYDTYASRVAQDLPVSCADSVDLYVYER